jgi:calcium-dependent protein kinase
MGCISPKKSSNIQPVRPIVSAQPENPKPESQVLIENIIEKNNQPKLKDPVIEIPSKSVTEEKHIVGNYEILEKIAVIPYGEIHKCLHISSGLKRTIKIIDIQPSDSISMNPKHLEMELKSLKSLDHPNLLKIHDMFTIKNKFFVVMEPWEGSLLIDCLSEMSNLNEKVIANIIFQILSAVAYCHTKSVIHRDLNPKIIFISDPSNPNLKISEFGSSAFMDPENKLLGKSYSKTYVAPEVFDNVYNEKCDLWSVGVIMHVLITGEYPYYSRLHPNQMVDKIDAEILEKLGISQYGIDLLSKLLEKDFTKRISAKEALDHNWIHSVRNSNNNTDSVNQTLQGLKKYKNYSMAQDSIREFIASQIVSYEESHSIISAFKAIDTNWDGKISKEELFNYYKTTMPESDAVKAVEHVFETIDRDKSGFIEYAEFVKASMKKKSLISISNIENAFKLLDTDNNSKLSKSELQFLLGENADKEIMTLINEADTNGDGEIDFKEFYSILKKKYQSNS